MYKLITNLGITSIYKPNEQMWIPQDPQNSEYQKYLKWVADGGVPEPEYTQQQLLDIAKTNKKRDIRESYEEDCLLPVNCLNNTWNGGYDSASKLYNAKTLAEAIGQTAVTFYDINNIGHALSMTDALTVCISVASVYQEKLAKKQTKMREIEIAETIEQVNSIEY